MVAQYYYCYYYVHQNQERSDPMKRRHLTAIFSTLIINTALASTSNNTIALTPYWPNKASTQFYGITVGGTAFAKPVSLRFDTEADTLIIPATFLSSNPGNYTVINPHVKDEWGNDAELVLGNVVLTGTDGTQYSVNMPIFAESDHPTTGYNLKNFGVGLGVFPDPQQINQGFSHTCPANENCPAVPPSSTQHCAGGFFDYYNYPAGTTPGFTINGNNTADPSITIGLTSSAPGTLSYQLPHRPLYNCIAGTSTNTITDKKLPACTTLQFWGTTVPNFTIAIQNTSPSQPPIVTIPNLQVMIDTGGGPVIIRDDAQKTYAAAIANISTPCPSSSLSFLTNCLCINPNQPITVSDASSAFKYSYNTSAITTTQQYAVAICPNSEFLSGGQAPFIFPGGANLGYAFFSKTQSVSYDLNACTVNATAISTTSNTSNSKN